MDRLDFLFFFDGRLFAGQFIHDLLDADLFLFLLVEFQKNGAELPFGVLIVIVVLIGIDIFPVCDTQVFRFFLDLAYELP